MAKRTPRARRPFAVIEGGADSEDLVAVNFRVAREVRKDLHQLCLDRDLTMSEILVLALAALKASSDESR